MKFHLPRLKIGHYVEAEVSERFANGDIMVDYLGDLVRVINRSGKRFEIGARLKLRVKTTEPLTFQLLTAPDRRRGKIDLSI